MTPARQHNFESLQKIVRPTEGSIQNFYVIFKRKKESTVYLYICAD